MNSGGTNETKFGTDTWMDRHTDGHAEVHTYIERFIYRAGVHL